MTIRVAGYKLPHPALSEIIARWRRSAAGPRGVDDSKTLCLGEARRREASGRPISLGASSGGFWASATRLRLHSSIGSPA